MNEIAHIWGNFCWLERPENVVIGTTLSKLGLLSGVENMCISYHDNQEQHIHSELGIITKDHVIDAKQRCLFLSDLSYTAPI